MKGNIHHLMMMMVVVVVLGNYDSSDMKQLHQFCIHQYSRQIRILSLSPGLVVHTH